MKSPRRLLGLMCCALLLIGARPRTPAVPRDPANPTCPQTPNWTDIQQMTLTPVTRNGVRILMAEGAIDAGLPERLRATLAADPLIEEIWLRSPGGNARAGNDAGRIVRSSGLTTRIPS